MAIYKQGKMALRAKKPLPTVPQKSERSKFGLVSVFLGPLRDLIDIGFKSRKKRVTSMNLAMSYHLANAVAGQFPDYEMDYPNVIISAPVASNEISMVEAPEISLPGGHQLRLNWAADLHPMEFTRSTDKVCLVCYNLNIRRFLYLTELAARAALTATVVLPRSFKGNELQVYILVFSANRKRVSKTKYMGLHTVAG